MLVILCTGRATSPSCLAPNCAHLRAGGKCASFAQSSALTSSERKPARAWGAAGGLSPPFSLPLSCWGDFNASLTPHRTNSSLKTTQASSLELNLCFSFQPHPPPLYCKDPHLNPLGLSGGTCRDCPLLRLRQATSGCETQVLSQRLTHREAAGWPR